MYLSEALKPAPLLISLLVSHNSYAEENEPNPQVAAHDFLDGKLNFPLFNLKGDENDTSRLMLFRIELDNEDHNVIKALKSITQSNFETLEFAQQEKLLIDLKNEIQNIVSENTEKIVSSREYSTLNTVVDFYLKLLNDSSYKNLDSKTKSIVFDVLSELTDRITNDPKILEKANSRGSIFGILGLNSNFIKGLSEDNPYLLEADKNGTMLIEYIQKLLIQDSSADACLLALDLILDLTEPSMAALQTTYPDCPSATIQNLVLMRRPVDYTRQVIEYYLTGETTFSTGVKATINKEILTESHFTKRSMSASIFQAALIKHGRGDSELGTGLNTEEMLKVCSDYFGGKFCIAEGGSEIFKLIQNNPKAPIILGFKNYESNDAVGHVVSVMAVHDNRLYFSDSNGNFGLHPSYKSLPEMIEKSREGFDWLWRDGSIAGVNPLPKGVMALNIDYSSGGKTFVFGNISNPDLEYEVPPPHFERNNPKRRLEDWSAGIYSISADELDRVIPIYFVQEELMHQTYDKSSQIYKSMDELKNSPNQSFFKDLAFKAIIVFGIAYLFDYLKKKIEARGSKQDTQI